ncbi:MAG: ATP synthase F0 subunit B [Deltaproteobacteria bacterium]|nr:ATP synthase F0 subunit B [Deltaproteobacteria bacterium]
MSGGRKLNQYGRSGIQIGRRSDGWETGAGRRVLTFFIPGFLFGLVTLTAAYASGGGEGGHEGPNWFDFTWRAVNLLILAGVLYWLLAKKIKDFFAGRHERIRTALAEAVIAREEAEKKFREYDAKLNKATGEIDEIARMIRTQGLAEKERIIADARKAAEEMKEDTRARMEQEFKKARQELRIEAVRLSTQMAGELLRKDIKADDHEALVNDYIGKVVNKT